MTSTADKQQLRQRMLRMLGAGDLCVLTTAEGDRPHASLMAYLYEPLGPRLHLITLAGTRKYASLEVNPRVSLLVDDREAAGPGGRSAVRALTVEGLCRPLEDGERAAGIKRAMAERLPHLAELIAHPQARVLEVSVQSLQLLEGPTKSSYLDLG